jgi:ribosome-associated protein
VIDAFDVMIHVFTADQRERYGLENLWKDAVEIPVAKLLAAPRPAKSKPAKTAKPAAPKRAVGAKKKAATRKKAS